MPVQTPVSIHSVPFSGGNFTLVVKGGIRLTALESVARIAKCPPPLMVRKAGPWVQVVNGMSCVLVCKLNEALKNILPDDCEKADNLDTIRRYARQELESFDISTPAPQVTRPVSNPFPAPQPEQIEEASAAETEIEAGEILLEPASTDLVTLMGDNLFTTTLALAQGTENEHASVIALVRKYVERLQKFGMVDFKSTIVPSQPGRPVEFALLNEPQATLLLALMRNSEIVVDFKVRLVQAFCVMKSQLEQASKVFANALTEINGTIQTRFDHVERILVSVQDKQERFQAEQIRFNESMMLQQEATKDMLTLVMENMTRPETPAPAPVQVPPPSPETPSRPRPIPAVPQASDLDILKNEVKNYLKAHPAISCLKLRSQFQSQNKNLLHRVYDTLKAEGFMRTEGQRKGTFYIKI